MVAEIAVDVVVVLTNGYGIKMVGKTEYIIR